MTIVPWSFSGDLTFTGPLDWQPIYDTGIQASIASLDATVEGSIVSGTAGNFGIYAVDWSTGVDGPSQCFDADAFGGPLAWPFAGGSCTAVAGATRARVYVYPRVVYAWPVTLHFDATGTLNTTLPATVYCAYGTQKQTGPVSNIPITLDLIATLAGVLASPWLILFLIPAVGLNADINVLCSQQRPPVPQLKDLTQWTAGDAFNFIQAAIWTTWCECSPATGGGPAPVTPPVITVPTPPGGAIVLPPVTCDNGSLCDMLTYIVAQMGSLQQQLAVIGPLVTLIQRQHVPFAYLKGAAHTGLAGAGTFAVHGILGLSLTPTSIPGWLSSDMAPVASYYRLGDVSVGTADGWVRRQVVTHDPHLMLEIPGDVTEVAYRFEPGVVCDIVELVREP
jgi:hypothetical protein